MSFLDSAINAVRQRRPHEDNLTQIGPPWPLGDRYPTPWRSRMLRASFRGAPFHVEAGGRLSGRRTVLHEYPKRDDPYAEDMGRLARKFQVTGYLIGATYLRLRDNLIYALEIEGPGTLTLPTFGQMNVQCPTYSVTEVRERGGYCVFEMLFVEAGLSPNLLPTTSTSQAVLDAAGAAEQSAARTSQTNVEDAGGATAPEAVQGLPQAWQDWLTFGGAIPSFQPVLPPGGAQP